MDGSRPSRAAEMSSYWTPYFGTTQLALDRTRYTTSYVIKNAVISSEKTLTRASAACERHAERPAWICARVSRSVMATGADASRAPKGACDHPRPLTNT